MKFKLPFAKKQAAEEVFFGLFLKEHQVVGFVIERQGARLKVLAQEEVKLPNGWDTLFERVDDLIFALEQRTKTHLEKTIFFVYSHLIDQHTNKVKKEYRQTFKDLVSQLELKPIGYIEVHEALSHYFREKEQTPLTALLVEVDKKNLSVILYKGGNPTHMKSLERGEDITVDLETLLAQIGESVMLPSRLLIYDSFDLHAEATSILSHRWNQDMFVQFPKIEVVQPAKIHEALVYAFETQSASEISHPDDDQPMVEGNQKSEVTDPEPSKEVMGFSIGKEIEAEDLKSQTSDDSPVAVAPSQNNPRNITGSVMAVVMTMRNSLKNLVSKIPMKSGGSRSRVKVIGGIIAILLLFFVIEYFFHKATIDVLFPSKTLTKDFSLTASTDPGADLEIKLATISAELSDSTAATGKRDVGDKAHGAVTIYNFDDTDRVVSKGVVLDTSGIKFTLDNDVKVASASISTINGTPAKLPGKNSGQVTASAIGPESNVAQGAKFSVGEISSSILYATNDTGPMSGGSKKQVTTVSKQDIDSVRTSLLNKAKENAGNSLKTQDSNEGILESLTNSTLTHVSSSKEVGEEAQNVTVKATAVTEYDTYSLSDLRNFLKSKFQDDLAQLPGFQLDPEKINISIASAKPTKTGIAVTGSADGLALKAVSKTDIVNKLAGKPAGSASNILKKEFDATGAKVKQTPIPFFSLWIPFFKKNIQISISSL